MKAAVIGGAGIQALGTIYDLLENPQVEEVMIADISLEGAKMRVELIGDERLTAQKVNILDENETASLLQGYQVVINCGPAQYCPHATRAALKAGVHYVDLGAWPEETKEQLSLFSQFEAKGITAVLGVGSAPGISNMMALYGVEQLDTVTDIDIIIAMKDFTRHTSPFVWPYLLDTILDEYVLNPIVVKNGEMVTIEPLMSEPVQFDHPIGLAYPVYTIHPEPVTLFESFKNQGCLNTSFRIALPEEFHQKVKFLVELGFGSTEPMEMAGAHVSPRQALLAVLSKLPREQTERKQFSVTRVNVIGTKNHRKAKVTVELYVGSEKKWNIPAGALKTSVPPSIIAQMLARGQVERKGVFPPEQCIESRTFFGELAKRGMETFSRTVEYAY
ncbi:saccharopine dehydrogenase family protein [Brevibacillus sp. B_LB10_24]|uniref:saccharopine dehydrogenase family protein n=1 Tax=Brevibacillus sp. B_LB10_24 TaxID=3380645 RepID=UPI0038B8C628